MADGQDRSSVLALLSVMLIGAIALGCLGPVLTASDKKDYQLAVQQAQIQKLQTENQQLKAQIEGMKEALVYRR
jgi:cell division protein FtsB